MRQTNCAKYPDPIVGHGDQRHATLPELALPVVRVQFANGDQSRAVKPVVNPDELLLNNVILNINHSEPDRFFRLAAP